MKTPFCTRTLARFSFLNLAAGALLFLAQPSAEAKIFDGGVDSANLGKGDWIYFVDQATNQLGGHVSTVVDIPSLMAYEKSQGISWIIVKNGTGSTNFNGGQFNQNLVDEAHKVGLKIFGYTRSYGDNIPGEVALATSAYNLGADGYVFDAEVEWESGHQGTLGPTNAWSMLSQVKTNFPNKFLGHAPAMYISLHSSFPTKEFGYWCDAVMPQCYWNAFGITPTACVADLDSEWRTWQNGLSGQWTNSIKPIIPVGEADNTLIPGTEVTEFVNALKATLNPATSGGYQGLSWWRADLHTTAQLSAIKTNDLGGVLGSVNPIVIDNVSAIVTGTWSSGTTATDKFGTDYRSRGSGTGANFLTYRPGIWTAGDYQIFEWHPQGSNRTTNAPHVIKHSGGSTTVNVNQKVNGGQWNTLGTFTIPAGVTGGHIRVQDNFLDTTQTLMADAMKLVYVLPSTPSAPSGLTAATVSSSEIDLAWTDTASNETYYNILRSTTAGGPYTSVMILAANSTSYSDKSVSPSTTYYYVVTAANAAGASANSNEASATSYPELIIDNPSATVVGTWSTATTSADKYGTNYRYKGSGTGSAYLQFTPNIPIAGDYQVFEWHPEGSNRTTNAPYVITYNGGTSTVRVRQNINGGQWNLLGTFNFATGTGGNVKIQDNFADTAQLVMADAIRFVLTSPGTAPVAPGGLSATASGTTQIDLSWADNSNNEDNFIVSRSSTAGGPYTDIATLAANTTSYSNTGLSQGTTYYYVVRAANSIGSSAFSNEASATTQQTAPNAPSGLSAATVSQTQINLSWTDNSNNESNFIVARSTTAGGPYTDVATLGANVTSYNNTGLSANTTYYYVVRASNTGGSSANSNEANATTLPNAPAAPSGLTATTISQSQIDLSWTDNSGNETGFTVARSATSGGAYSDIATLGANVTSYSDTGLSANTTYYYVVRASNTGGSSANSAEAGATTLPNAPAAPGGLAASAANTTQINLSWTDNSNNETSFTVARSATSGGPYSDLVTVGANVTIYSDTGLTPGSTYYYVVRAGNSGGSSADSAEASATTPSIPSVPNDLSAVATRATRISLSWTDTSANETSFIIARSLTSGGPYTDIATNAANDTTYIDTGLTADTAYYYVVRAVNTWGASANCIEAGTYTFESNLLIDNRSAVITGAWSTGTSATDKYGTNYRFIGNGVGDNYAVFTPYIANAGIFEVYEWHAQGANRTTNAPLIITYNGGVQTNLVNQKINGGAWNLVATLSFSAGSAGSVKITDAFPEATGVVIADAIKLVSVPPPTAPSGLTATTVSQTQINLSWTDNATSETSYVVSRSSTAGGPYTDIATLAANATSYSNTGLSANTAYYYVVRAENIAGASANSNEASATTLPNPPTVPSGLTAGTVSQTQINLSWTDNSNNEANFIVARSATSGGPYTDIVTLGANVTSYNNTGLSANTTYYYVVRASNTGGASANSAQASATTLPTAPAAPSALAATAQSSSSIKLTWTDNSNNEDNFIVARATVSGGPYTDIVTLGANVTTYTNTGLTGSTTYYYVVRASNTGGASANSAQASATTFPTAPSGLTAIAWTSSSIKLTWTDNSSTETAMVVSRATVSGGPYTDIVSLGANITTWTNTGLTAGTTYYYVVRATNTAGASPYSAQASALAPADIIIDNPSATVVGTWSSGTSSTDKLGTDYRFKSQGTGTSYLEYRPNILAAGNYQVYEFHPAGTNRTTNAPVVVTFSSGTVTNRVNQKINGGVWVATGSPVNFSTGTGGFVRVQDNFSDVGQNVMADGIKFVKVP